MSQPARGRGPVPEWVKKAQERLLSDEELWQPSTEWQPLEPMPAVLNAADLQADLTKAMTYVLARWQELYPGTQAPAHLLPEWERFDAHIAAGDLAAAGAYLAEYLALTGQDE